MPRPLPRAWWIAIAVGVAGVAGVALAAASDPAGLARFLGRFHPLIVHLPIGGLAVAAVLAVASRTKRLAYVRPALAPVLAFCAVSAVVAVMAGQLLAADGAYASATFIWHQRLGYAVVLGTTLAAVAALRERTRDAPRRVAVTDGLVAASTVLIVITGHLGGTLTRGPGYLTEHMPGILRSWLPGTHVDVRAVGPAHPGQVAVYADVIDPILRERCVACHGPARVSGGLRLDTPEHIRAGGDSGAVVGAGAGMPGDLVRRIWLPVTHPDVMPPRERAALTVAEASLLRWWVEAGASFDATLADIDITEDVHPAIEARVGPLLSAGPAVLGLPVPPLDASMLASLIRRGLPVARISEHIELLQVQARGAGQAFGNAEVDALLPVADQITWLDLGGTAITDDALVSVARFPHLSRLHLDRTAVTDAGLARIEGLAHLEYLNLYGTGITDAGLETLATLPRLRALYLWQTAVTPEGIAKFATARPDVVVNVGE